jgi:periplasmic copper chaperone A
MEISAVLAGFDLQLSYAKTGAVRMCKYSMMFLLAVAIAPSAQAAGHLVVEQAWIRAVPKGTMMLAGYATLRNEGDAPLMLTGADGADFGAVSMHESIAEHGVEHMRPLGQLHIAPGARVEFAPGGKHFMLMHPMHEVKSGDKVKIHIATDVGVGATAEFVVRDEAPAAH